MSETLAEEVGFLPQDVKTIASLAFNLIDAGQVEEAAAVFEGLLEINPRDAAIRAAYGAALQTQGRVDDARTQYDLALAEVPTTLLALVNRAALRLSAGEREAAMQDLQLPASKPSPLQARAKRLLAIASGV